MKEKNFRKEDLIGLDVFNSEGINLGVISDVEFTLNSKMKFIIEQEGKEDKISFELIDSIWQLLSQLCLNFYPSELLLFSASCPLGWVCLR